MNGSYPGCGGSVLENEKVKEDGEYGERDGERREMERKESRIRVEK